MRALVFSQPGAVKWREVEEPKISEYGAIIRPVLVSPCSSDVYTVFGGSEPKMANHILGHEAVGEVVLIG